MFGPGRPASKPNITNVRALEASDLASYKPDQKTNRVLKIRESHHRVARLMAIGLRNFEIAERTGYSEIRISHFRKDPAFMDLVSTYSKVEDEAFEKNRDVYYETVISNRQLAANEINDRLQEAPDEFTVAQLVAIHSDAADRTGYPKRTVATNINLDFAARLDRAVERTNRVRQIEGEVVRSLPPALSGINASRDALGGGGEGEAQQAPRLIEPPPQLRRRA